jgi:2-desacetyl-2-hydroxyethyl bacteriochlorophyllide A dehydrogenase
VKAALVRELPAGRLDVTDVPEPELGAADEVIVAVEACGICGTDLHILDGGSYRPELPFVLGHEPVGTVVAAGEAASEWLGRRITITLFDGCGRCRACRAGYERVCPELRSITGVFGSWGGFAERMLVRSAQLVDVPEALSSTSAAVLIDAGTTALNAARLALEHGGERAVVAGGGPVGFLVAERLRAAGIEVAVVEPQAIRRDALARFGHQTTATLDEAPVPDIILDCAGAPDVFRLGLERLAPRGLFIVVGYSRVPDADLAPVARKELTIRGVRSGSRSDLAESLELAAAGALRLPTVSEWSVDDVNEALRALREGEVSGKAVIVFDERKERKPSTS